MRKAIFPNMLKVAQVTPIYKKRDSQLLENYCMQDSFARARTRPKRQARATIGYLVYNENYRPVLIYVVYHYSRAKRASADLASGSITQPLMP